MAKVTNSTIRHIDCTCGAVVEYDVKEPVLKTRPAIIYSGSPWELHNIIEKVKETINCPACGKEIVTKKY